MDVEFFIDKIGQKIVVGSYIVYGQALGRCAALGLGKVLKLSMKDGGSSYSPKERISVQGVNDSYTNGRNEVIPPSLSGKGTLMFPDRIIVLDPATVPADVKKLLDEAPPLKETKKKKVN